MTSTRKYNTEQLNDLLNLKEKEWRCVLQEHVDTLVKELADKEEAVTLEKLRFHKLKEDFEYNLKLLEDRDKDLHKYEALFEQMKGNDNLNNHQVSEMKIKVDEFQLKFNLLEKEKEEMQHHYQMRLKHYQEEMNKFYSKKEEEHQKERNEYEQLKRELQRKIRDTEEEIGFEKQKFVKQLDENIKQKEKEFQIKLDKNEVEIHSYQLKVKMLSRELQLVHVSNTEVSETLETNKEDTLQLGRLLKEKEWELQDTNNMKDIKIKELEAQLDDIQRKMKWKTEEFERKYCELEKLSNERESILTNLRTSTDDHESKLCGELKLLRQQKEEMELNYKRLQWQLSDQQMEKEKEVQKYSHQVEDLERKLNEEMDAINKATVAKDLEIEALRSSEDFLRKDASKLKSNIDRLKKDLSLSMDRERILENAKVQVELDWRRRYETKESDLYEKHDNLIRNLNQEKDEAIYAMKQNKNELSHRENLIKLLEDDKLIAIKCLNEHGIDTNTMFTDRIPERESETTGNKVGESELEQRNNQLKEVIKVMRAEMEMLSQQITSNTSTPNTNREEKSNYVNDLEGEIQKLKASNRKLLIKMEDMTKEDKPPIGTTGKINVNTSDPGIKSYFKELNETIGVLRNDKVVLSVSLNSKEATISHQNDVISRLTNEKQQQVVLIDNLKYDITSKSNAYEQKLTSTKQRISELELQLQQARSEAEIYYKNVMERNSDAIQANNKLSELRLQQSSSANIPTHRVPVVEDSKSSSFYKEKLKLAVERIKELAIERSQLISVGNKLRAELVKLKENTQHVEAPNTDAVKTSSNMRHYGNKMQSKLEKLEQLKYEATREELKKDPNRREINVDVRLMPSIDMSEITDDGDLHPVKNFEKENLPPSPLRTSSEHSSIKEIWKLLDNTEEISIPDTVRSNGLSIPDNVRSNGNNQGGELGDNQGGELVLVGKRINPDGKGKKTLSKSPVLKAKTLGKSKNKPLIRNYNQKNDR